MIQQMGFISTERGCIKYGWMILVKFTMIECVFLVILQIEKQLFGLKPMNCPGHCLIFDHRVRSYRGELF